MGTRKQQTVPPNRRSNGRSLLNKRPAYARRSDKDDDDNEESDGTSVGEEDFNKRQRSQGKRHSSTNVDLSVSDNQEEDEDGKPFAVNKHSDKSNYPRTHRTPPAATAAGSGAVGATISPATTNDPSGTDNEDEEEEEDNDDLPVGGVAKTANKSARLQDAIAKKTEQEMMGSLTWSLQVHCTKMFPTHKGLYGDNETFTGRFMQGFVDSCERTVRVQAS
jgi:hypothetical protein